MEKQQLITETVALMQRLEKECESLDALSHIQLITQHEDFQRIAKEMKDRFNVDYRLALRPNSLLTHGTIVLLACDPLCGCGL